ncbi:MAG: hypothetical protein HKM98_09250, partial [Gammaproteobacteria bacterium]|nr:hypothetical protein [Gammaproteobacteria bacterium]
MALDFADESPDVELKAERPKRRQKVNVADRLFLIEQLALMLENGLSLHAALTGLAPQIDKPALKELVNSLADQIESGKSFSHAVSMHPEVFD